MLIAADTEVAGLHRSLKPFMVTACDEDLCLSFWEWSLDPFTRSVRPSTPNNQDIIRRFTGNEIIFHHAQFDICKLANIGLRLQVGDWIVPESPFHEGKSQIIPVKAIHDTLFMSHLVDSRGVYKAKGKEAKSSHALKELCLVRLGVTDADEIALRKAVQSARLKADKLGWKKGASVGEDYWLPYALWKFQQELHQTRVVNCKTNEYDVLIDRTTEYGNPFKIGKDGNRDQVIKKFADNCPDDLDLYPLVGKRLGCHCKPLDCHGDVYIEKIRKQYGKLNVPPEWEHLCRDYALRDVKERTMMLFQTCREILQSDGRWDMYLEELPLLPIYYMLEENGLPIDPKRLKKQRDHNNARAEHHQQALIKIAADPDLNINSDPQLRKLIFGKWNLTASKFTPKKKEPSVDAKALEGLRDYLAYHPDEDQKPYRFLTHLIGEKDYEQSTDYQQVLKSPGYRQYVKMNGYIDFYDRQAIKNVFHATIHPVGTGTTRISTEGSQNVGNKKVDGVSLRTVFGPPPGSIWVSIDYEQLELRIFAHLAHDLSLINAFDEGYDFHAFVATKIFNLSPEKITSEQRRIAKNTNFAIIFGGSPWKVDLTAGMPGAYAAFSKQFPSVKPFMDENISLAKSQGFILTADGYPLYAPVSEPFKATDYRVQGTAGRIIKLAMKWLFYGREWIAGQAYSELSPLIDWDKIIMRCQIHDELVFEIKQKNRSRKEVARDIRSIMRVMEEAGQSMGIATPVDCKVHRENWSDGISLQEYLAA